MNRHERRAAEARARSAAGRDKDFEAYQAMYRHAFHVVSERDIGEGYMRGEVAKINGVEQVVIHPLGGSPTPATETDIHLSARYRSQRFVARVQHEHFRTLVDQWPNFVVALAAHMKGDKRNPVTSDQRSDARSFLFEMIVDNGWQNDPLKAALTASAMAWLTSTSPVGATIGHFHRVAHYEITDQDELSASGRRARNYRLVLARDMESFVLPDLPVPKW